MLWENLTVISEFNLMGFTDSPELQVSFFVVFLIIYFITIVGNLGMIVLITVDPQLHTPMYFFLSNLSLIDFYYSSNIAPNALENFLSEKKSISFAGCFVQMYLFIALTSAEFIIFGLMAYDHYVAICNLLLYTTIMSQRLCLKVAAGAYAAGFLNSVIHTSFISSLSFCQSNVIDHFFCEIPPLLKLSCSDTHMSEMFVFICVGVTLLGSLLIILSSYTYIFSTILKICSAEGRPKAFSTCASHLIAVTLFYGTGLFIYLQPSSNFSQDQNKIVSVFYTFVIPMLNPFIYSLRNKEVKDALKRAI
ncbi:olfactory receptor 5F1-like [Emydura macquarii macquarii]|uniref:olfactory receptor 5F1-like n=1 Tax=Emydura macquarii macquarii TaxID=1129001 RepID=UPI00352BACE2